MIEVQSLTQATETPLPRPSETKSKERQLALSGSILYDRDSDNQNRIYANWKLAFPKLKGFALNAHTYDLFGETRAFDFGRHGLTVNIPKLPKSLEVGAQIRAYSEGGPPTNIEFLVRLNDVHKPIRINALFKKLKLGEPVQHTNLDIASNFKGYTVAGLLIAKLTPTKLPVLRDTPCSFFFDRDGGTYMDTYCTTEAIPKIGKRNFRGGAGVTGTIGAQIRKFAFIEDLRFIAGLRFSFGK